MNITNVSTDGGGGGGGGGGGCRCRDRWWWRWALPLLTLQLASDAFAYRILGVFPHQGLSHFMMFEPLMLQLAHRGHQVVVLSRFPQATKVRNYEDVDVGYPSTDSTSVRSFQKFSSVPTFVHEDMTILYNALLQMEQLCKTEGFQNFWKTEQRFDLVIVESFNTRAFLSFAHRFGAPLVAVSSCGLLLWSSYDLRNPINPSYIAALLSYNSDDMNFVQRLTNVYVACVMYVWYEYIIDPKSEELKRKYLGADIPPLRQLSSNTSLLLVNTHLTYNRPRPFVPAVVEVGGLYLKPSKSLPPDIERFINESKDGVVYFCMGSLLRGETFPAEKRNAFLTAFSKIPQRVLWKWEGDVLPGKSDDIMISKWMPQRDILAHPNVKLFISHGGLLGTSEAVYEGVPILGIPIFGDQRTNVKAIEANGAGLLLDYNDIGEEVVLEKIRAVLNDPKYKEKAKQLSDRYRDRPMSPLDTAVYWTEYVIRHKGAAHLRTAAVDMPWHQYLLLDVIAFLLVAAVSLLVVAYYACKVVARLVSTSLRRLRPRRRAQKEKRA